MLDQKRINFRKWNRMHFHSVNEKKHFNRNQLKIEYQSAIVYRLVCMLCLCVCVCVANRQHSLALMNSLSMMIFRFIRFEARICEAASLMACVENTHLNTLIK